MTGDLPDSTRRAIEAWRVRPSSGIPKLIRAVA